MKIRRFLNQITADLRHDTERGRMVRAAGGVAVLKLIASALAFFASLIYARALGPHDYGLYAYVIAWTGLLAIPSSLGIPRYFIREGAKQTGSIRWLCHWADARLLPTGLLVAGLLAGAAFVPAAAEAGWLFIIAAPLPLLTNLVGVRTALLQAQGLFVHSQWPQLFLSPALMLIFMAGLWFWQGQLRAPDLIILLTLTSLVPLGINELQLRRSAGFGESNKPGVVQTRSALPFMWLGMLSMVNSRTDLIMLGTLKGAEAAGVYAVAMRVSEFVPFFLMAANTVIAPRIARLHQLADRTLLQRLISASATRVFYLTLPVALFFLVFAEPLIRNLFGTAFSAGSMALQILTLAQLLNVLAGPTGLILNMTGHENLAAMGFGISTVINLALNAILIPVFDVNGAATATGASMIALNIMLWYWVRRQLRLSPSAFGY